jgi:hypothetical protein
MAYIPFGLKYVLQKQLGEGVFFMRNNKWIVRVVKVCGKLKHPIPTTLAQFDSEKEANEFYERNKTKC